jgi:tellurite resistance protein TerC
VVLAAARPDRVGFGGAIAWSEFYILVAIAFGIWFAAQYGDTFGTE